MTEDKFDEFLRKAAQSYNLPPARTPRDDMWNAIQAQRAARPRVVYGGGSPIGETSSRRFGSRMWLGAAAAAVLFLATGVGIGRWSASSNSPRPVATMNATISGPSASTEPSSNGAAARDVETAASTQTASAGPETSAPRAPTRDRSDQYVGPRVGNGAPVAVNEPSSNPSSSAYQLTAVRHLSEAEALLTSFRTRSNADQQMDAQLGSWARALLSNTRLLLDSPVANDPQRRPLLEDLELVLVQIVQLSPGSTSQDRELIEKTLQQDHVMTRLRTAIPAGPQRGS
jgi:hypothetical protein